MKRLLRCAAVAILAVACAMSEASSQDRAPPPAFVLGSDGLRKPNGAFVYLVDGVDGRISDIVQSLTSLDRYFNGWGRYPVVVFYPALKPAPDDTTGRASIASGDSVEVTPEQMQRIRAASAAPVTFAAVDFESYVDAKLLASTPPVLFNRWGIGYRHMCNFFAGPVAHHPALAGYRYYWRQDADSQLVEPLTTDPFFEMAAHSWRYGYALSQCDWHGVTEGLASTVARVVGADALAERLPTEFSDNSCERGYSEPSHPDYAYNNRIIYNNFEIVDLEFMRAPAYGAIYEAAAASGGIFNDRWGDAPIRTLAVFSLLPPDAVHRFSEVSYYHQGLYGPVVTRLELTGVVAAALAVVVALACLHKRFGIAAAASALLCTIGALFAAVSRVVSWCCCCGAASATCTFPRILDALCCLRVRASAVTAAEALALCNSGSISNSAASAALGSSNSSSRSGFSFEAASKGSGRTASAADAGGLRRVGGGPGPSYVDTSCAISDDGAASSSRSSSGADSGSGTPRRHSPPPSPADALSGTAVSSLSAAASSGGAGHGNGQGMSNASSSGAGSAASAETASAWRQAWSWLRLLTPLPTIHYARCSDALNAGELAVAGSRATVAALRAAKTAAIAAAASAGSASAGGAGAGSTSAVSGVSEKPKHDRAPLPPIRFDSHGVPQRVASADASPAASASGLSEASVDAVVRAAAAAAAGALPSRVASFAGLLAGPLAALLHLPAGGTALASVARWLLPLSSESAAAVRTVPAAVAVAAGAGAGASASTSRVGRGASSRMAGSAGGAAASSSSSSASQITAASATSPAAAAASNASTSAFASASAVASAMRRSQSDPNGSDWERRRRLSSDFLERSEAGVLKTIAASSSGSSGGGIGAGAGGSALAAGASASASAGRRDRASSSASGSRRGSFSAFADDALLLASTDERHKRAAGAGAGAGAGASTRSSAGSAWLSESAAGGGGLELPKLSTAAAVGDRVDGPHAHHDRDVGEDDHARLLPPAPIETSRSSGDADSDAGAATGAAAIGRGSVSLAAIARIAASGAVLGGGAAGFLAASSAESDEGSGSSGSGGGADVLHADDADADADWGIASGTPSKPVTGGRSRRSGACRQRHSPGSTLAMAVAKVQGLRWLLLLAALVIAALLASRDRVVAATLPGVSPLRSTGCLPSDLDCLLAAHSDARRRIIVTGATSGMTDFLLNLFVSLRRVGAVNLLVFALDAAAADWLASHNVPVYWDPAPLAALPARLSGPEAPLWLNRTAAGAGGAGASGVATAAALAAGLNVVARDAGGKTSSALKFGTDAYRAVTLRKNEMMLAVLARGYNPIFTDADTVWLRNPLDDVTNGPEPIWGDEITMAATGGTAASQGHGGDSAGAATSQAQALALAPAGQRGAPHFSSLLGHRCSQLRLGDTVDLLGELDEGNAAAIVSRSSGCHVPTGYAYAPRLESFNGLAPTLPPVTAAAHVDSAALAAGSSLSPLAPAPASHLLAGRPAPQSENLFPFDVKGMYGDWGGLDTGFWYARSTPRMIAHMRNVVAYQRTAAGLALPSDQENFNEVFKPWLADHLKGRSSLREWMLARDRSLASSDAAAAAAGEPAPAGTASDGAPLPLLEHPPLPLPFTAADVPESVDNGAGLGPARVRVAFFEPLEVPNGCRLPEARRRGANIVMVHANCYTGWPAKVAMLVRNGFWFARFWEDRHVAALAAAGAALLLLRLALARALVACGHADEVFVRAVKGAAR